MGMRQYAHSRLVDRARIVAGLTALGFVAWFATGCTEVNVPTTVVEGIHVAGTGTVKLKPDIANVQIGVQTFNADAQVAVSENNDRTQAIIDAVKQLGVADKDIQTTQFSVTPQRDWTKPDPNIIGFQVNNTVAVKMRNLDDVGKVLQASVDAGANNIFGLDFTVDDPTPFKNDARVKAIEDARQRAESMAKASGVKVGKPTSIVETSAGTPPIYRTNLDKAAAESSVPVEVGELELTVTVDVVFEID
jgi:hypothetical protein